jgi:hypothetical protein
MLKRRSPSPVAKAVASPPRRNPVRTKAVRRSPSPIRAATAVAARRSPSPTPIDVGKILLKGTTRANLATGIRRSPSPTNREAQLRNYERSNVAYKPFIEQLRGVLYNEKIIDRDNDLFETFLADQQKWNHLFYNIKPRNMVCFIICDYQPYERKRVFHKNNKTPYFGDFEFNKLLKNNKMSMKWAGDNMLYIHKDRYP